MKIEYVSDNSGDWEGVYADGKLIYDGHSIPTHIWLQVLGLADKYGTIREWETDLSLGGRYPLEFDNLEYPDIKRIE